MEGNVVVGRCQQKSHWFSLNLCQPDQTFHEERLQPYGHEVYLGVCHRHKAPVVLPGSIVNQLYFAEILFEGLFANGPELDLRMALPHLSRDSSEAIHRQHAEIDHVRQQILGLSKALLLNQVYVVGGIIRHHEHGRGVKPVHEQSAFIVRGRVQGPNHSCSAILSSPAVKLLE